MKKATLLLLGAAVFAGSAQAQLSRQHSVVTVGAKSEAPLKKTPFVPAATRQMADRHAFAKGTSNPFYTQTFAGGIPTGWTAASLTPGTGTWRWANAAAGGSYSIGVLNSTTASNGWMLYNSDSLGAVNGGASPFAGTLTSATIPCTGHSTVKISFQQYFRSFDDSCFVDVSNNNGVTWTPFSVQPNNSLSSSATLPSNPTTTNINISSVAANQANVMIRFRYVCNASGGGYNWLVDDMTLSELDPVDLSIAGGGVIMNGPSSGFTSGVSFSQIPLQFVDTLFPVVFLTNGGATAAANTVVNAKIFYNGTQVYSQNLSANVPVNGLDSLVDFSATPYKPTQMGNYMVVFSINPTGDVSANDNTDTTTFAVTDTVYALDGARTAGAYYVHRPAAAGVAEVSFYQGARFTIDDNGGTDTLTSLSVSFANGTTVGSQVQGQVYKAQSAGTGYNWTPVARTVTKTLAAGDITAASSTQIFTSLKMVGVGTALTNLKLGPGDYAAVITGVGATASQTILINSTTSPYSQAPTFIGYTGQSDTSLNNANYNFAVGGGIATGSVTVPRVRANFGHNFSNSTGPGSVGTIPGVTIGEVYPNPSNTFVNVPVSVKEATEVSITISNVMGQTVRTHNMGTINAGNTNIASISTSDLANGVYIYTINANGQRSAGRIVVSH